MMNQKENTTISGADILKATEKRMEKYYDDIKAAIIAHLDIMDPAELRPLYMLVRASARKEYKFSSARSRVMIEASKEVAS